MVQNILCDYRCNYKFKMSVGQIALGLAEISNLFTVITHGYMTLYKDPYFCRFKIKDGCHQI